MRNPIVQMLPAGATIDIPITPPITASERPFVLTMYGTASPVAVTVESDAHVKVHNPMTSAVPFVFFIGPQVLPPQWIATFLHFLTSMRAPSAP